MAAIVMAAIITRQKGTSSSLPRKKRLPSNYRMLSLRGIFLRFVITIMCIQCKRCSSEEVCKSGFVSGNKQRYLCKACGMNFTEGDKREKYSHRVIQAAIDLYIEGNGFRRTSRLLKKIFNVDACFQLVIHWVKAAAQKIDNIKPESGKKKTSLLKPEELFTYIKKNRIKSEYGLLLIETGYVLLDLKATPQALQHSESSETQKQST